jgi:hypothetical protein
MEFPTMKKNEDRKLAEKVFLGERGRITNKLLAQQLAIHPATIARWRRLDEWDVKLVQGVSGQLDEKISDETFYAVDLRHLTLLNERIDAYLRKKELLPSEIRELAEAKLTILECMGLVRDQIECEEHAHYPEGEGFD